MSQHSMVNGWLKFTPSGAFRPECVFCSYICGILHLSVKSGQPSWQTFAPNEWVLVQRLVFEHNCDSDLSSLCNAIMMEMTHVDFLVCSFNDTKQREGLSCLRTSIELLWFSFSTWMQRLLEIAPSLRCRGEQRSRLLLLSDASLSWNFFRSWCWGSWWGTRLELCHHLRRVRYLIELKTISARFHIDYEY